MRKILLVLFLLNVNATISFSQYTSVSYYIVAHPDDWELFMGVNAFNDIILGKTDSGSKVVFIYTTAGDANCNGLSSDSGYYVARQTGANRAVGFCADIYTPHATLSSSYVTVHGIDDHNILRFQYKNVFSYFLRLPDGCMEAVRSTIKKLHDSTILSISSVDGSTTYSSYEDLVETLTNIISTENGLIPERWINTSDWDNSVNPVDHPDHMATGLLAATVSTRISCTNVALFEGYHSGEQPSNLSPEEIAMEAGLHCQASFGLTHAGYGSEWDFGKAYGHVDWTSRNYFRVFNLCGTATPRDGLKKFITNSSNNGVYINVYPNPAQTTINLSYLVMENSPVRIKLYGADGRYVDEMINENKNRGVYNLSYNIDGVPPGIYIIDAKMGQSTKKLQFVKR